MRGLLDPLRRGVQLGVFARKSRNGGPSVTIWLRARARRFVRGEAGPRLSLGVGLGGTELLFDGQLGAEGVGGRPTHPDRRRLGGWPHLCPVDGRLTSVEPVEIQTVVRELIDEYRARCLWFLRPDYYPESRAAQLRILASIERYGDARAFQRVAKVREWLSPPSSAPSAGS